MRRDGRGALVVLEARVSEEFVATLRGEPFKDSLDHILAELSRIELWLRGRIDEGRAGGIGEDAYRGLYISQADIDGLLAMPTLWDDCGRSRAAESLAVVAAINARRLAASDTASGAFRLHELQRRFGLNPLDRDVVLLCFAPEVSLAYEKLFAFFQDDVTKRRPSVDLALKVLCDDHAQKISAKSRFYAEAPLIRYGLIEFCDEADGAKPPLLGRRLRIDPRIVRYLLGSDELDERLAPFAQMVTPGEPAEALAHERALRDFVRRAAARRGRQWLRLHGRDKAARRHWAETLCAKMGLNMLAVDAAKIALRGEPFDLARAVREAVLQRAALYLDPIEALLPAVADASNLTATLASGDTVVVIGSESAHASPVPAALGEEAAPPVYVAPPHAREREGLWRCALGVQATPEALAQIPALAGRFRLTSGQIAAAAEAAKGRARWRVGGAECAAATEADLYASCRERSEAQVSGLARKVALNHVWEDLVLPPDCLVQLREICDRARYRSEVLEGWGFERRLSLGRGLSVMFSGASGVGKTMAAEVMAGELGLDLYKIDLSCIVSKYIGETEKNLARLFAEAEESNVILFFDEADALFGKRSEVQDAHDRHANVETSYLLQRMEEYEGVSILATNLRRNMDDAFLRRIAFIVHFPLPEAPERLRIWRGAFPAATPLDADVDLDFLSESFRLSGASITSIALASAFLARSEGAKAVAMRHLVRATRRELNKLGKSVSSGEFGPFASLLGDP
jgi:ATPase family associated with various cellular activities (AAA)